VDGRRRGETKELEGGEGRITNDGGAGVRGRERVNRAGDVEGRRKAGREND